MTRYAILVALLALCMVSPASAGVTRFPNGIVVGDINDSPTVTPGADDLYVKGTFEVDGAVTLDSTFDVDGSVTLNGDNTLGNASTDTQTLNGDTTISGALVAGNDGAPLILKNASATCFAVTTNGNPSNGDVIFTFTNGDAGTMTMIADDGADQFIFNKPIDVSDVELATLSARDGSLALTLSDSTGNVAFAGVIDASDIELATASARDGSLALTFSDSTGNIAVAGVLDVSDVEQATISARDGTLCGTLSDSSGNIAFNADASCVNLTASSEVKAYTISAGDGADAIVLSASTGNAAFAGVIDASDAELATISARDGALVGTLASSTGNIDLAAALDVTGVATFDGDVDLDATGGTSADPDFSVDGYTKLASLLEISAQTVAPVTASTAAGTIIYIGGSPNADQDTQYISDGGGGTEGFQANEPYMWNGSKWVPMFTGITP